MAAKKVAKKKLTKPQRLWLEALRSGKFRWGKGELNPDKRNFCCLGVACIVAEKHGVTVVRDEDGLLSGNCLSEQILVKEWLGLRSVTGDFLVFGEEFQDDLAAINDGASRNPFRRIADIIESQPDKLFVD